MPDHLESLPWVEACASRPERPSPVPSCSASPCFAASSALWSLSVLLAALLVVVQSVVVGQEEALEVPERSEKLKFVRPVLGVERLVRRLLRLVRLRPVQKSVQKLEFARPVLGVVRLVLRFLRLARLRRALKSAPRDCGKHICFAARHR